MVDLNKYLKETGYFNQDKPIDDRYEFTKGVTSALKSTVAGGKALLGSVVGDDNMTLSAINDMRNNADENAGKVGRIEDINGVGDFTDWLSYNLGSGTASIATMVGSGGLGGLAVKGLAKGALVNATKATAATAAGFTPNYGESVQNAYDATGDIKSQAAFASASIKTMLDMIVPAKLMKAGIGKAATKNYSDLAKQKIINDKGFTTWAKEMISTGKTEAFTEGLQTYTDQVMVNVLTDAKNPLAVRNSSEIFNAMAAGGAGSMGFGVYSGVQRNRNAQSLRDNSEKTNESADDLWSQAQTDEVVGNRINQWQEKRSAVAKNGIDELIKQGATPQEATESVRLNLIGSAIKQGMTEENAASSADDAINRQESATMQNNDPAFFDKLNQQQQNQQQVNYDVPTVARNAGATNDLEAGKFGDVMFSPAQESLRNMNSQTPAGMVDEAKNNSGFTPQDRAVLEGEVSPKDQSTALVVQPTYTGINGDFIEGELSPKQARFPTNHDKPAQITDKNIVFTEDANKPEKINVKASGKPFKNERLLKMSRSYKEAESNKKPIEIINLDGGLGWRVKTIEHNNQESIKPTKAQQTNIKDEQKAKNVKEVTKEENNLPLPENSSVSEKDLQQEPPQKAKIKGLEVVEAPVNELSLSNDVPQFKDGANTKGVVDPLGGKFERTGVAPIQVWVRSNGDKEVISGRHRLDLAQRSGENTIPSQYHYEDDGFTKQKAASLDALLNVREGQGKVKDYVKFIQQTNPTEKEAESRGILARATGKRAYTIANLGSDSLITAHRNNGLTDEGAARIAQAAPNNEALQAVGIKAIDDGKTIAVAENLVKAVKSMTSDQKQGSGDLFGFDDSAMIEAENLAKAASKKQAEIQRSLSAIQGAAKRPELAAKEGVNVKNPKAVNQRIEQLKEDKRQWDNWHTNPELVSQLKVTVPTTTSDTAEAQQSGTVGTAPEKSPPIPSIPLTTKTASQEAVVVSDAKENDVNDTITQETDLFAEKSIDEAAHEAATSPKNDSKEPSQAQKDANNYKLGRIKHSGFDIGIENPEGSNRTGIDPNGKEWSVKMTAHYGDLTGTIAADGDALDVFVKPSTTDSEKVFVVDQVNPGDGKFDEAKILMGFDSKEEAEAVYLSNYSKGWKGLGNITEVSKDDFKAWVKDGDTTKPFATAKDIATEIIKSRVPKDIPFIRVDNSVIDVGENISVGEYAKKVREFAKQNIAGKKYHNNNENVDISVSMSGIRHTSNKAQKPLLSTILQLPDILSSAVLLETKPDKNNDPNVKAVHYYGNRVKLDGDLIIKDLVLVVKEDNKGHRYYDHSFEQTKKALNSPYSNQGSAPQMQDGKPSKSSITPKPKTDKIDQDALFSRSVVPDGVTVGISDATTVSQADTEIVIDSIVSGWDGGSLRKQDFVVVSTFDELPQAIKDAAKDQGAEDGIGGVFHKGKTYLVRDKLANAQDVEATIFHETYGHHGIRKLFGKDIGQKLNQLLVGIGGINGLDIIAKKYGIDLSAYKKGLAGSSLTNAQAQTILMDELLAHLAQNNKPSIMRKVKEIIGAIRQWLKKSGFIKLSGITDSELFYILKQARGAVKQGSNTIVKSDIRFSQKQDGIFNPVANEAESYRDELSKAVKSLKSNVPPIKIGRTPKVLTHLGSPDLDLYIRRDTVRKATNKAKDDHDVPMSVIEQLPELLADPVAVFKDDSPKGDKGIIVLVDAVTDSNKAIVIPIHLEVIENRVLINRVASVFGRNNLRGKKLIYLNESKKPKLGTASYSLFIGSGSPKQGSNENIATPSDIVNGNDIRFSRVSDIKEKLTPKKISDSLIANEDEGLINQLIRHFQDKFKPLKTVQKIIEKSGKAISDLSNAYVAEELFHGKAEEDLRKMEHDFIQPLVDVLTANNIEMPELDLYLIAKHAMERNEVVSSKNDAFDGESGSGMTNDEAQAILDKAQIEGKTRSLEQAASKVYAMTKAKRELLSKNGLLSDGELDTWESSYNFYVPLKGFASDEFDTKNNAIPKKAGKGFSIRGSESIRALGRRTMAASPTTQVIQDLTESIIRARKNEVGNVFLNLVEDNPDSNFWQVFTEDNPEIKRSYNKKTKKVEETKIPMAMMADNYFTTKVDGETYYIKLEDTRLMNAMKNLGVDKVNSVTQTLGTINRYLSTINTSLNPEFIVSNMARDIQTAVFNVLAEQDLPQGKIKGKNIAGNMIKDWAAARKGIALSLADKDQAPGKAGEYQKLFDQFREDGAKTGYFDMKDIDQQVHDINNMLEMANNTTKGKLLRFKKKAGDFVENINQSVENAVRLSAYKQALDAGISRQKAASLAKNLTVNFNRKGEVGTTMNALYMFANASVQGTAQFLRSMQGYRDANGNYKFTGAQKAAAGFVAAGFALAALNRASSDDDDDGVNFWDKIPDYIKERNIVIMKSVFGIGEPGEYYSIPLPYGYNFFSVLGTSTEGLIQGNKTALQTASNITGALLGSFSPIGAQSSDNAFKGLAKTITPTIGQPIIQLGLNENFYGGKIYRENYQFGTQKPDSSLAKRSTHEAYKAISSWLNEATGGSYYRSGVIDINPEVLKYFVDFSTGAAGTFAARTFNALDKSVSGEDLKSREIPFYRKLNGETNDDWSDQSNFYDRANEIKQVFDEYKSLKASDRKIFKQKYNSSIALVSQVKATEKILRNLRKRYKAIEANNTISKVAQKKLLDTNRKQQDSFVDKFNLRYNAINK